MTEKKKIYKLIGTVLPIIAIGLAVVFVKTKPKAERKKMSSMIPVVEITTIQPITTAVVVQCMGTVIADRETSLEAEVNGRITAVQSGMVEGSRVNQGDVLITIDPRDYELAVAEARAALQRAESSLRLEEGSQAVSKHEMELIGAGTTVDPAYQDLMLRKPQLQTAQANVDTARANLDVAQLKLDRTQIRAPFDAVVQAVSVSEGDTARAGKTLVKLVARDRLFVRASLPVGDLKFFPTLGSERSESAFGTPKETTRRGEANFPYKAKVTLSDGAEREGVLLKFLPDLSEGGRMARVLVVIDRPFDSEAGRSLMLDEVVRVEMTGREMKEVCLIDRMTLRDGSVLWMIDPAERLHVCPAEPVQGYADQVLVRAAFSNGWKLVTSDIPAPVDGMQLRIYTEKEGVR